MWANDESKIQFLLVSYIRNDDSDARLTHTHIRSNITFAHFIIICFVRKYQQMLYQHVSYFSHFHTDLCNFICYYLCAFLVCGILVYQTCENRAHWIYDLSIDIYYGIQTEKKMANLLLYLKSSTNMPHLSPAIEPKLYYLVFVVNPENRLLSSPGLLCACVRSGVHCENPRYTREQILYAMFLDTRAPFLRPAWQRDQNGTNISTYWIYIF